MREGLKEEYKKVGLILKAVISLEICKISASPIQKSSRIFVVQGGSYRNDTELLWRNTNVRKTWEILKKIRNEQQLELNTRTGQFKLAAEEEISKRINRTKYYPEVNLK